MQEERRSTMPWAILGSAFLLLFAMSVQMFCVPPMQYIIKEELAISYAQTSLIFTISIIGMVALGIPGGFLADRFGIRKAAGIGVILVAFGAILRGVSTDYSAILAFTLIIGIGGALIFPNLPKLVSLWVPREKFGTATGLYSAANCVGNALAVSITLVIIFPITGTFQGTFLIWGFLAVIAAIVWWVVIKDPPPATSPSESATQEVMPLKEVLKNKNLWLVAVFFFLHQVFFLSWLSWAPILMLNKGATPEMAAVIASTAMWVGIPTVLFAPRLSDKLGLRKPFLWITSVILACVTLWAIYANVAMGWLIMLLVGSAGYARFVTILVIPAELLPARVGLVSGLIASIGFSGGIIGPLIVGRILDSTGSLDQALIVLIGVSIAMAIIALKIPETGPRG